jgi:glycosyltransferase involved in cell wall biosynthesis
MIDPRHPSSDTRRKILVVAPFMHRLGHFSVFPLEMAAGFSLNGASVTLLHPFPAKAASHKATTIPGLCLADRADTFTGLMKWLWHRCSDNPILLCLAWLTLHVRPGTYDLVYWSDFKSDNQQSTWPLGLASLLGLYPHRTAFTEHHNFSWNRHRWQRLFRLDRIRLRRIEMFVHSRKLLEWIRLNMNWPAVGHYVAHGLWPDPTSDEERTIARRNLGIADDARVLLVFGLQAVRRKEIDTLAEAIRRMTLDRPLVLLFAGMKVKDEPHPFDMPELTQKANLHIRHHESFIPDEAVKSFFAAADAVWAYYGAFIGASGVLAQAIAFGRLSICSDTGESGEICRQYRIGLLAPTGDLAGVQAALSTFMSMSAAEQASFEAATHDAARELAWPNITRQIMDISLASPTIR